MKKNPICYYCNKTIQISTKTPNKLENIYKRESKNMKLLTRLKLCKNIFTCEQRVKGNHMLIVVDGSMF